MIPVELLNTWGGAWFGLMTRTLLEASAAPGPGPGGVAALAATDVGAARAWAVLSRAAQGDHPGSVRRVRVAAALVGAAGDPAGLGLGAIERRAIPGSGHRGAAGDMGPAGDGRRGHEPGRSFIPRPDRCRWARRLAHWQRRSAGGPFRRGPPCSRAPSAFAPGRSDAGLDLLRCPPSGALRPVDGQDAALDSSGDPTVSRAAVDRSRLATARRGASHLGSLGGRRPARLPPVGRGLLRPAVIVPPDLHDSLTPNQLTWVLLHELAHVRRGDLWVVMFQRIVQAVFFFNPTVHLVNWIIDELREYACDDAALAACQTSRSDCGEGFLAIIERSAGHGPVPAPALGLFEGRMLIRRRLLRILDSRRTVHARLSAPAAFALACRWRTGPLRGALRHQARKKVSVRIAEKRPPFASGLEGPCR